MVFSVNQVRQLYVVNKLAETEAELLNGNPGSILVGNKETGDLYFKYVGALKDIMRSDIIKKSNISYFKTTKAADMAYKLKGARLTLDPAVNSGLPVAGQDYILRLAFREYIGMTEADQYFKYGMVHVYSGLTASDFYKEMALSLVANISKDITKLVDVFVVINDDEIPVTKDTTAEWLASAGDVTEIRMYEAEQPWHLGTMPQGVIPFEVQPTSILVDGDHRIWGKVVKFESNKTLEEGQLIADLEYFCMGERGDQYRNIGWPNVIPTKYLVDPEKKYDVINIHYFYQGDGISVQKSEKDIQLVVDPTVTGDLEGAIKDILG